MTEDRPHRYNVLVARENDWWLAEVPELAGAHTYSRTLTGLDRKVREVIALMADLPAADLGSIQTSFTLQLAGPLSRAINEVDEARRRSEQAQARAAELTRRAIAAIAAAIPSASVRDIARMLGISHQRVHQLQVKAARHDN